MLVVVKVVEVGLELDIIEVCWLAREEVDAVLDVKVGWSNIDEVSEAERETVPVDFADEDSNCNDREAARVEVGNVLGRSVSATDDSGASDVLVADEFLH